MHYPLIFHTEVETDISDAYNWYENKQAGLGERLLSELAAGYQKLAIQPELFSKAAGNYRKLTLSHFPYSIIYEIVAARVFVYAVFHTRRNPRKIAKRGRSL